MRCLLLLLVLTIPALAEWKMTWRPFVLKSKTGHVQITGKLPVLKGPGAEKLNARLRLFTLSEDPDAIERQDPSLYAENHYTEEVTIEVTRLDSRYLSVQRNGLGMLQRAAHPSVTFAGLTLRLPTAEAVPLSEFLPLAGLRERIQAEGRKEVPDVEIPARQRWDWVVTPKSVRFLNLLEGHAAAAFMVELPLKQ